MQRMQVGYMPFVGTSAAVSFFVWLLAVVYLYTELSTEERAMGAFVTPLLVGGSRGSLYGNIIQDFFTKAGNWPFGSALSMIMLVFTLLLVALALRVVDLRRLVV